MTSKRKVLTMKDRVASLKALDSEKLTTVIPHKISKMFSFGK